MKVSLTNLHRAQQIYDMLSNVARMFQGQVMLSELVEDLIRDIRFECATNWEYASDYDEEGEGENPWQTFISDFCDFLKHFDIPCRDIYQGLLRDDQAAWNSLFERLRIAETRFSPEEKYNILQWVEGKLVDLWGSVQEDAFENPEQGSSPMPSPGLAASYHQVQALQPEDIAIIPVAVKENAPYEWFPQEEEVRFYPWDILPIIPGINLKELKALQQSLSPRSAE